MNGNSLDTAKVNPEIIFGRVYVTSRFRIKGNRLIGEGRTFEYDKGGNLVKDTGWQPTGIKCVLP